MKKTQTALICGAAIALTLVAYLCFNSSTTAAKGITASTNGKKSKTIADDQFWQHDATTSPIAGAQALQLNRNWWEKTLRQAPLETPGAAGTQNGTVVTLPAPDGGLDTFRVVKSPIMEAELAARYPQLQTFAIKGMDDPTATGRLSWTPEGLHAIVLSSNVTYFVEPLPSGKRDEYHSFTLTKMLATAPKFS